jgi:hypothetical protein
MADTPAFEEGGEGEVGEDVLEEFGGERVGAEGEVHGVDLGCGVVHFLGLNSVCLGFGGDDGLVRLSGYVICDGVQARE